MKKHQGQHVCQHLRIVFVTEQKWVYKYEIVLVVCEPVKTLLEISRVV